MSRAVGRRADAQTCSQTPRAAPLAACIALGVAGCTTLDNAVGKIPWFTTMRDQAVTRPFEALPGEAAPRGVPPGSVPVTGHEDSLDLLTDLHEVANPVARTGGSLVRGRRIYDTYCVACHGAQGGGDGPVAGKMGYVPPLVTDMTKQRTDGYIYAVIRQGRGIMPRYGDKIRGADRWNVVNYVRRLQGAGNSAQ
ncbi:MAG: cytochrome c [Gemmatimonadales bacterium]|nr:cytochrome c [Gemmatimonadales bacterium]